MIIYFFVHILFTVYGPDSITGSIERNSNLSLFKIIGSCMSWSSDEEGCNVRFRKPNNYKY